MNTGLISRLTAIGVLTLALLPALHAATDNAVVTAAKDGDLRAVRALVAKRINVNEPARDGSRGR